MSSSSYPVKSAGAVDAILFDKDGTLARYIIDPASPTGQSVVPLSKDLGKLCQTLKQQGITLGIASRDGIAAVNKFIEMFKLGEYISFLAGADSNFEQKPHPEVALAFLEHCQASPDRAMVVGDSPEDMELGKRSKFKYRVGTLEGFYPKADLEINASDIISSVDKLPQLLANLSSNN